MGDYIDLSTVFGAAPAWHRDALCSQVDPELFFPEKGDEGGHRVAAKKVCRACPVTAECLLEARRNNETHGIWGGLTVAERERLRRLRPECGIVELAKRKRYCDPCRDKVTRRRERAREAERQRQDREKRLAKQQRRDAHLRAAGLLEAVPA